MTKHPEPPINRDLCALDPEFRARLGRVMIALANEGIPFFMQEGLRTVDRQQWIYGQGRLKVKYGRSGMLVTKADGIRKRSNHQSGRAADCYPANPATGKIIWPPPPSDKTKPNFDPRWERYAELAEAEGLSAGLRWKSPDAPHVELLLPKKET